MIKLIKHHWDLRRIRFYRKSKWHLVLDISLGTIIILLIAVLFTIYHYHPDISHLLSFNINRGEHIDLNNPPITINYNIDNKSFKLEKGVKLNLTITNSYTRDIKDIKLKFIVKDNGFTINKIDLVKSDDGVDLEDQIIKIKKLSSKRKKSLELLFNFNSSGYRIINWGGEIEYSVAGQKIADSIPFNKLIVITEPQVISAAYYNSPQGDQLGAGPIPPIAYLPTNYWIFWTINKPRGEFKDFVMSAKLPQGIELTSRESVLTGLLRYNSDSRRIIWKVSKIDTDKDVYQVAFEVQLIPKENQIGQILPLITNTHYYTKDIISNTEVSKYLRNLSTNLDFDKINKGQGKVLDQ